MTTDKYLHIYLTDHLAGAVVGIEVAKRAARSNATNEIGDFLRGLIPVIEQDRDSLEKVLELVGAPRHRWKLAAAWLGEKLGRLKLNGELTSYSPLSRLVELEALSLGVRGKWALWESLEEIRDPRLQPVDLGRLIARAEEQYGGLEAQRRRAATMALGGF